MSKNFLTSDVISWSFDLLMTPVLFLMSCLYRPNKVTIFFWIFPFLIMTWRENFEDSFCQTSTMSTVACLAMSAAESLDLEPVLM